MSVPLPVLPNHMAYHSWANLRLLDAAGTLSDDELARDFKTSDRTVAGTLMHIYSADRLWLARVQGTPFSGLPSEAECNLGFLRIAGPNHGTHHRGQVSGFLRSLGHTPPPLDLAFYYRGQA